MCSVNIPDLLGERRGAITLFYSFHLPGLACDLLPGLVCDLLPGLVCDLIPGLVYDLLPLAVSVSLNA